MKANRNRGWRYWRNLSVFSLTSIFIGLLFFQYLGVPFCLSYGYAHPKRAALCCITPADWGLKYEDVSFTTRDGLTLRGWYLPSQNKAAVILTHGIAANRVAVLDPALMLARNGFGVLLFDLRAHGESDSDLLPYGGNEAEDVRGAAAYLQTRADVDPGRIGAMGLSLGAQVSILGAGRDEAIKAVVADGPGATTFEDWPPPQTVGDWLYVPFDLVFYQMLPWRMGVSHPVSVQTAIAQIAPRPILVISGGAEQNMMQHHYAAAREFLDYVAILKGVADGRARRQQIDEVLELVRLTEAAARRLKTYSGGMKRRVGIAQALLGSPKLLIVDEPKVGLDPEERVRLRNLLGDVATRATVILSTHIVEDISQSCNDLAVINHGQVLFRGSPRDLIAKTRGQVWNIVTASERPNGGLSVVSTLQSQDGVQYRVLGTPGTQYEAKPVEPSLEDGYIWLMQQSRE